jgi:hypothetical protein
MLAISGRFAFNHAYSDGTKFSPVETLSTLIAS